MRHRSAVPNRPLLPTLLIACALSAPLAQSSQAQAAPTVRLIKGDPSRPGPFVTRITFPPGLHTDPHAHSTPFQQRVISGPYMVGLGSHFDTTAVISILPGSTVVLPAGVVHFDWFPFGGELEVTGMGPDSASFPGSKPSRSP